MQAWSALNRRIISCEQCPRLREYGGKIAKEKRKSYVDFDYWARPVANFGDPQARLLIVGLAPAAHGANRTGRMFTGDRSGDWLFRALHKAGFANQAESSTMTDGLVLTDCAITAVCHCAPPDNKPTRDEIMACRPFLQKTIDLLKPRVLLALGQIGWKATLDELIRRERWTGKRPKFSHAAQVELDDGSWLLGSYHPSQQNTFTRRLTEPMLDHVFTTANKLLADCPSLSSGTSFREDHR